MQDTYKDHIEQNKQYYFFHVVAFFVVLYHKLEWDRKWESEIVRKIKPNMFVEQRQQQHKTKKSENSFISTIKKNRLTKLINIDYFDMIIVTSLPFNKSYWFLFLKFKNSAMRNEFYLFIVFYTKNKRERIQIKKIVWS